MTKPRILAIAIALAGLLAASPAAITGGVLRGLFVWIGLACALTSLAYLRNQPAWLGKQGGTKLRCQFI